MLRRRKTYKKHVLIGFIFIPGKYTLGRSYEDDIQPEIQVAPPHPVKNINLLSRAINEPVNLYLVNFCN